MTDMRINIAFITGRSRPDNLALSPSQSSFLQSLLTESITPVTVNFPWLPQTRPWCDTGLLRASCNNARDYLTSRRAEFGEHYRKIAIALVESADHTLLLSGSCGLELFNNLHLPAPVLSRVSIFAYGPVARRHPDCHHLLIQGQKDLISRLWFHQVDERIPCGHMDYLSQQALVCLCKRFINQIRK